MSDKLKMVEAKVEELKKSIDERNSFIAKMVNARKNMLLDIKKAEALVMQADGAMQAYMQTIELFKKESPELVEAEIIEG